MQTQQTLSPQPVDTSYGSESTQKAWNNQRFPVLGDLIKLVKTLECTSEDHLSTLKSLLINIGRVATVSSFVLRIKQSDISLCFSQGTTVEPELEHFLRVALKLHQVLALVDVDFSKATTDPALHLTELVADLKAKGSLDYFPREHRVEGRFFDHACEPKLLLDHLKGVEYKEGTALRKPLFFISLDSSEGLVSLDAGPVNLTLKSDGKTELYFHGYFWATYLKALQTKVGADASVLDFVEFRRLEKLAARPAQIMATISKFPFSEKDYFYFVKEFGTRAGTDKVKLLESLQRALFVAQIEKNKDALFYIEKILVQLLGYFDISIRDQAIILLNTLYDGVDWQLSSAFNPVVRCVGQHFKIDLKISLGNFKVDSDQLFVGLSAPCPLSSSNETVLTWHKIMAHNVVKTDELQTEVSINFGKFWKCGFYDWRVVQMSNDGKLTTAVLTQMPQITNFPIQKNTESDFYDEYTNQQAQGRFVVQARGLRDQTFHEVQIDYQDAKTEGQNFVKRGTFKDVEKALPKYKSEGVSALYLMGAFQRDNDPISGDKKYMSDGSLQYKKEDASPLAVTSRNSPCTMLGGKADFKSLMATAKKQELKILVDSLARVSSSRHHRKYKNLLLNYLCENGRRRICYGTDGQARKYEDTAMLNYRKVEAWDLLVQEVLEFVEETGVDGIHLDNGQAWPQINELNLEELFRLDDDGQPAYTAEEIMNGEVVIRNENYGYWNSNAIEFYANPFFVKLCKQLWQRYPNFMVVGECWGGFMFEHRQIVLSRSGIIPRLFKLPQAICSLFGKKLHSDGRMAEQKPKTANSMYKWYNEARFCLPEGSILIQSSTAHSWPYPAYLYGKGTWAAVDILYFMPDVPITFMGEVDGEVFRLGTTSIFQAEQTQTHSTTLKRSNSQVMLALTKDEQDEQETHTAAETPSKETGLGVRVRSQSNLAALLVQQVDSEKLKEKEKIFIQNMGPDMGFDLKQINSHYRHRRQLRQSKMVLRYGEMIPLQARGEESFDKTLDSVLSFARYSLMETAIVAINVSSNNQNFYVDVSSLTSFFKKTGSSESQVVKVSNLLDASQPEEYFFLQEFLTMKHWQQLPSYSSAVMLVTICSTDEFVLKKTLQRSLDRTKEKLLSGQNIEAEQLSQILLSCLKTKIDTNYFAKVIGSLQENFLGKLNLGLTDMIHNIHEIKNQPILMARLVALTSKIDSCFQEAKSQEGALSSQISAVASQARLVHTFNTLGPIVFCTPEIGRWSTVGGLGVMVDELALGLAEQGQEVIVISPYYDRNRQGRTGYLAQDPAGFKYVDNLEVITDFKFTLGVHEGVVGGVRLVFLHNHELFPAPYPDLDAKAIVRQMAVFGKACLEYCCKREIIPSVCVTNDWFTGFVPGYAKIGSFGDTFKGSTFLHIAHNLQESYEGRVFPEPRDGYMENIHQLRSEWLFDPQWQKLILNPSRCAIICCDQWATVSKSYCEDLLRESGLRGILGQKPRPFAYPNGIPIKERISRLDKAAPTHEIAKAMLQKKYFNFQEADDSIPLFGFVGRVTQQKGVHLILEVVEEILNMYSNKVMFIVAGPANMREPYAAQCAHRMWHLKEKFPFNFWAAPQDFFTDGALLNRGADFGLMPSMFEPGGIVQHEFFVGGTPVVAFKTGGLKDSVIEFQWNSETGCGFTFEGFHKNDLSAAIQRAIGTFNNKQKYAKIRENAFRATMPGEVVTKAWLAEFFRLRGKIYFDYDQCKQVEQKLSTWEIQKYKPLNVIDEIFGKETRKELNLDDIDFGAEGEAGKNATLAKPVDVASEFDRIQKERVPFSFMLHNRGPKHTSVSVTGSFDNWQKQHPMKFDHITNQWFSTLHLKKGEHFYKYVINGVTWVINEEETTKKDPAGNVNNCVFL